MKLFSWLGKACEESPGVPSSTRIVMMTGTFLILFIMCGAWAAACWHAKTLVEIPASVGATLGSYLLTLLGAKVLQSKVENGTPQ